MILSGAAEPGVVIVAKSDHRTHSPTQSQLCLTHVVHCVTLCPLRPPVSPAPHLMSLSYSACSELQSYSESAGMTRRLPLSESQTRYLTRAARIQLSF
jgi:hypothetical protein